MKLTVFTSDASKSSEQEFALPTFEGNKGLQAVKEVVVKERRQKVERRRQIDPTTCERDYTNDEILFSKVSLDD